MAYRKYSFEKLIVWQKAKELAKTIYSVTRQFPVEERYGFTSQMRRSAVSVPSNIAEGSARITQKDKAHFTTQSYSSLMEVLNHAIITNELEMISDQEYIDIREQVDDVALMLSRLRNAQLK